MHTIYHDFIIKASCEEIFTAVSQPHELINWWPKKCSGEPKIDAAYNFYFSDEYDWYGLVSEIEVNDRFVIKMTVADEDWTGTSFGFNLKEVNNGTLVSFHHAGWSNNAHFRRSSYCWALLLNGLKNYIEKAVIIPFEKRN